MKSKIYPLFFFCFILAANFSYGKTIEERLGASRRLFYEVLFNGLPAGKIEWRYLGKEVVYGRDTEVIAINCDTNILKLLNLQSNEKIFIDSATYLPVKVERKVVFFGKKETIEELYDQDAGTITIIKSNSRRKITHLSQKKPIHNILSLLYFFPTNIALVKGQPLYFNLPTQKVTIKMLSEGAIAFGKGKKDVYFLSGRGGRRFNLWLDKEGRIPVKMEFLVPLGRITIVRKN